MLIYGLAIELVERIERDLKNNQLEIYHSLGKMSKDERIMDLNFRISDGEQVEKEKLPEDFIVQLEKQITLINLYIQLSAFINSTISNGRKESGIKIEGKIRRLLTKLIHLYASSEEYELCAKIQKALEESDQV